MTFISLDKIVKIQGQGSMPPEYSFICFFFLQGPAGLKGGEGPQGPPGPVVRKKYFFFFSTFFLGECIASLSVASTL